MPKKSRAATKVDDEKPPLKIRYTLDDRAPVMVDVQKLTLGERAELEDFHDKPWRQIGLEGWLLSEKGHAYLAWIGYRRRSKGLTLSEVMESSELTAEINPEDLDGDEGKGSTPETPGTQPS